MFSDQIGRYFAVIIFSPVLVSKGMNYEDLPLIFLGLGLFLWDLYWLLFTEPKVSIHKLII
jgi:hypothetical protein